MIWWERALVAGLQMLGVWAALSLYGATPRHGAHLALVAAAVMPILLLGDVLERARGRR